jgi:transposase
VRIEQTYRRHGTVAILAGLDVRSGQVTGLVRRRRRHQEFLELLQALRRRWPRGRLLVISDNLSIHTHRNVTAWLATQQGRVRLEFLPLHASCLNQIELWFSVLERQCLKRASAPSGPWPRGSAGSSPSGIAPPAPSGGPSRATHFAGRGPRIYGTLH